MAIIEDIKCQRCDRKYSSVRSRCPYCGARRIGFGKYSKDTDNSKGKMLISVLIMAVLTVAAGIMLFSTPQAVEETPSPEPTPLENINSLEGLFTPPPTVEEIQTPPPPPAVSQIAVHYGGGTMNYDITQKAGTSDNSFHVIVEPPGVDADIKIESSDEEVVTWEWVQGGRLYGFQINAVGTRGENATLTVSCGDLAVKIIVRMS